MGLQERDIRNIHEKTGDGTTLMPITKTYEDGLRDGELRSLRNEVIELKKIVDDLSRDVCLQGRVIWLLCGAIALAQFVIPILLSVIDKAT